VEKMQVDPDEPFVVPDEGIRQQSKIREQLRVQAFKAGIGQFSGKRHQRSQPENTGWFSLSQLLICFQGDMADCHRRTNGSNS